MKKILSLFSLLAIAWLCNVAYAEVQTLWTEDFSSYSTGNVPTGGDYNYVCVGSGTKIYNESTGGGTAPELLVAKNSGSFSATIPLNGISGELTLTYKSNKGQTTLDVSVENATLGKVSTPSTNVYSIPVSVTEGTEAITIKFNNITAKTNARLDDITLTAVVEEPATELTAPVISGVENGGVYWNSATVNISKPALATSIAYDVKKNGVSVASATEATGAFSQEFTEAGNYTVTASATNGTETKAAESVSFEIKSTDVASIADFLAVGPLNTTATFTFTCPLTVTYASGKNVYVRDDAGDALLIYNTTTVSGLENGSILPVGVAGTYTLYLSNIPEMKTAKLPDATAGEAVAPKEITIADATAANMSQYVQIKHVTFNSTTEIECGGETLTVSGTAPENLTAQYTVTGVISYKNNALQLNLISATVEVGALGTPVIEVAGETNAKGAYLDKVELTFVYPANATSMQYKIGSNDAVTVPETTTITYSTCGETTIEVTAYQNEESNAASKTIKIIPSAPTLSLAAGTYNNAQTLTITAPEGATLEALLNEDVIEGVSTYTTTLVAVDGEATKYELLVNSKKDGVPSDLVSATFVIDPNVIEAEMTGTIVFADQDPNKFIASGANMKKDTEYILTDDLNNEYTITSTIGDGKSTYPRLQLNGTLRLYNTNGNVIYISNDNLTIKKVAISHNRSDITINDNSVTSTDGVSIWEATADCHQLTIVPTASSDNTDISAIAITFLGNVHYDKVKNGNELLGMEAGKFYQVNVNLEGVKENGGVLYARTADDSVEPSDPKKNFFDKGYEDYDLKKFTQRDWVAIDGLSSAYAGTQIATGFVASYDGTKLVPVKTTMGGPGSVVDVELNTFGVANVFYGNYEHTEGLGMQGDYQPFFVKAKVNEVAKYLGEVTKDANADGASFRLQGSGKCGVYEGKGLLLEAAEGVTLAVSNGKYMEIEGVLVETTNAFAVGGVKLIAMNVTDTLTGVEALKANGKAAIYGTEGAVVVAGADGKVMIFDAMGRMVKSVSAEGAATVEMPAGYYIVRTAGTAKAVIVK